MSEDDDVEPVDNVIPFPAKDADAELFEKMPLRVAERWDPDEPRCVVRHKKATIHEETRRLICVGCGAELDPFDYLVAMSRKPESFRQTIRELARRREYLAERVASLERLERNAKSRLNRVRASLAATGVTGAAATEFIVTLREVVRQTMPPKEGHDLLGAVQKALNGAPTRTFDDRHLDGDAIEF